MCIHIYIYIYRHIHIYVYLPPLDSKNSGTKHFVLFTALSRMPKILSGI